MKNTRKKLQTEYVCRQNKSGVDGGQQVPADPVFGKLVGGSAATLALVVRPLDSITLDFAAPGNLHHALAALLFNIQAYRIEIAILGKRIECDPYAETVGEGDFLLHRFALLELALDKFPTEMVRFVFRQQMATVGGYIDQDVFGRRIDRSVQCAFEHFVTQLPDFKGQIIAEQDEPERLVLDRCKYFRKIDQIFLFDLNKT